MLNQNQNRYKFTSRPSSSSSNQSQTTNTNNRSNYPQQNYYQNRNQFKEPPKIQPEIIIDDDDDLLDISDTELIRASQAVESQLKFTNNIHQTTSNAITIFSQITSNTQQQPMAPPPPQTTTYSTSNYNNYDSIDDIKYEMKQLKNENMQKDGEVKILRDKLKRLEQETQKMRNEKFDLVKKLQQQHEETKKSLQKHIEVKDLESQFKSQELMEITTKYKVLQSSILKNSNNQQQQQQQSVLSSLSTPSNQKIQQPKSLPTKRAAQTTNLNSSDTENDNPSDIKRPRQQHQQTPKTIAPLKTKIFKRNQVLNTKSSNTISTPSDLIYKLTDKLSETTNLLTQINQGTKTSLNSVDFQQKLHNLNTYLQMAFSSNIKVTNTERIDYISDKLNEELIKLLKNNLDLILVHIDLNQIDLNCSLIQTLFRLFLIRFDLLIDSNNAMVDLKPLNKLKQQFFLVLSQCLESLNFNNSNKLMFSDSNNKKNQNLLLAYWSLKIFINLFDLINYLTYLPLNVKNPKKQIYYVGLADNLHSIFKNLSLVGDMNNRSSGHVVDEDDTCLLQLFYDKLNKFFSDVLYLLETSENRQNNLDQPVSKELEIITTIVDESKNSKIDFKLENRISENYLMNNSLSECDNDIFQSQVDPGVTIAQTEPPLVTTTNHQGIKPVETIPSVYFVNPDLSQLKLECFTKFAYLIHNYQFINSLEAKFKASSETESVNVTEESSCKKRKIYQSMSNLNQINNNGAQTTHNESCGCFKEMLNSYLCLIDYQFGDKLSTNDHNISMENSLDLKDNLDLLLLMVGFNSYVTVVNTDKYSKSVINSESVKRKLSVLDTISEDYRLKNFFSLFNLFDRALDKNEVDRMQIDEDLNNNNNNSRSHHLNNSFNSLRLYFKSYVDDYFDFTQN
ncbi:unnamed protein product [Brachionus calyciflorus]|uniref:Uncharacterized protein n=1 Tax=Brachionus calyciflorus TaxID=104777 RepID=A0A813MII7_9BILA|nr:unnamed protein product [Brachionus calyciflorus]